MSTERGPHGWGGSCRGGEGHAWVGVGHTGVGWVMQGGVSHTGWGESCRCGVWWIMEGWDGVGHTVVGWVIQGCIMQGCSGSYRGRVGHAAVGMVIHGLQWGVKISLNNLICYKLGILFFLLTNHC